MWMEQLSQTARGFIGAYECAITKESILKELERVKWFLWRGNLFQAAETLTDLMFEADAAIEEDKTGKRPVHLVLKKLARALEDFGSYIDNNASGIVNYGERRRCGERISTGFAESTINQVIAKRFVKKQQMEATSRGWSERRSVIGYVLKFGLLIQRVRIPPGQSVDPQAGSEPCSGTGNYSVDA